MKLRNALVLGALALVVGVLAATLGGVAIVLNRAAKYDTEQDLARAHAVFEDMLALRRTLHRSETRVVAEEPRLKAAVATQDITPETVLGVARELRRAVGTDLFLITDARGKVLADVEEPDAYGMDMSGNALVAAALREGTASAVWTDAAGAYEVEALRLGFGATPVGVLVLGYHIDGRLAVQVYGQTGSGLLLDLDGRLLGGSLPPDMGDSASAHAGTRNVIVGSPPIIISLAGGLALAQRLPMPGYKGKSALTYTLVDSLADALAPKRRLQIILLAIGAFGLLGAVAGASLLAHRLSDPVDDLVAFTRAVAAEQLDKRTTPRGPVELVHLGEALNRMVEEMAGSRASLAQKQRLESELEIATRIQTSILPRGIQIPGLEIAAAMKPADEVGGDYYDVQPAANGCWIGIGDVAGHGLTAGLVMMMTQSAIAALVRTRPSAGPGELIATLNRVIFENVRKRLAQREHMTLSLLRYRRDGSVSFAGAHEDIVLCRANGKSELVETPGTWIGAVEDVSAFSNDYELQLHDGDLMVLHTDGLTQASDAGGQLYGVERLCAEVERLHQRSPQEICDHLMAEVARWSPVLQDDVTVMVLRYRAEDLAAPRP
jgi:sigma-B regulation protein RsbU (phosphoserine phosphatase)